VIGGIFALQTLGSQVARRVTEDRHPIPEA
jgi:hypothetical protein